jgi:zinc protease
MFKIRNLWLPRRGYRFGMLLFSVCLSATLALSPIAVVNSAEINPDSSYERLSQRSIPTSRSSSAATTLTANVKKTVLANGLTVLTKEVKSAPVVTVQVWYKIGSKDEAPGVNGIAHALEHMLFKGTKERPIQFGRLFSALGSNFNATTSYDRTEYHGTVEKNKLTSMLTLEADRMQNATIDNQKLTGEKRVVISELQGRENSPSYRLARAVRRAALPDSPYGLTVGGTKADVEKFTVEQVRSYYDAYYAPNNATLVVVGDFNTADLLAKVRATFGKVPRRDVKVTPPAQTPTAAPQRRITLNEPGSTQLVMAMYPAPNIAHPDVPALDVMNQILTQGRTARMYRSIVETGIVTSLSGGAANLKAGGWYELSAVVDVGKDLTKVEAALQREIAKIQATAPTPAEVARAQAQLKAVYLLGNRSIDAQARQLGSDITTTGDYQFTDKYLAGVARVTAADIQRVAKTYLTTDRQTIGFFQPTQVIAKGADAAAGKEGKTAENYNPGTPTDPRELAKYLPPLDRDPSSQAQALPQVVKLKNGLRVFLLPDRSTPTVTLSGNILAGAEYDPANKAGIAGLTANNLMNGTTTKTELDISTALENRGAGLGFAASREGVGIGGSSLSQDLPILLATLGDVLQNANFPAKKVELSRQRALTALKLELDNPSSLARRKFQQTVYPQNHPFATFPTAETLASLQATDLQAFYRQHYLPSNTMLALVGDFKVAEVKRLLNNTLGKWNTTAKPVKLEYPTPKLPDRLVTLNPTLPGKTQSITILGNQAIDRQDPRFYAALVLNQILGGDTLSSRLGTEIRDRLGLTYGITSSFAAGKRQGTFIISMQTAPEDAQTATQSTIALLKDLQTKGVASAEVDNAKRTIASKYAVNLASPDAIAGTTLSNAVYGLNPKEISEFPQKITAVTLAQVNKVAKELIQTDRSIVITVGPPQTAGTSQK